VSSASSERLNRYLARRGVASRRAADTLIAQGRVTVNGRPGSVGAVIATERDRVAVDGASVVDVPAVTLMLNKPPGFVTTRSDPQGRRTVMDLVDRIAGLVPVGRLDADTRGLLLLSTDGELAHRVAHPRYGIRKTYTVRLESAASPQQIARLVDGVLLDDGPARAVAAQRQRDARVVELVLAEGRKREIRRMCAAVGLEVVDLQRTQVGPVVLGALPEGAARALHAAEDRALRTAVGLGS